MVTLVLTLVTRGGAAPAAQTKPSGTKTAFGNFSIENARITDTSFNKKGHVVGDLTGPQLVVTSPQYTLKAPHIHLELSRGGKPPRSKVTDGSANGGVHVVSFDKETQQKIVVDGDKAVYKATLDPNDRGKLEVTGHVHVTMERPDFPTPWDQHCDHATLTFPDAETTRLVTENTTVTGSVREPEPKPKPKQ